MRRTRVGRWTLCQRLREALPDVRLRVNAGGGQLKNQMKRADASGANWALIVGEDEVANNEITLKWLRADAPQERLTLAALIARLDASKNGGN